MPERKMQDLIGDVLLSPTKLTVHRRTSGCERLVVPKILRVRVRLSLRNSERHVLFRGIVPEREMRSEFFGNSFFVVKVVELRSDRRSAN
jgi:hypothetical protein